MWRNTENGYGWISIGLHWLVAIAVIGLFAGGLWMVGLDYYHPWNKSAPEIHKSVGILLFGLMLARLAWRFYNPSPRPTGSAREQQAARLVHRLLYSLMVFLMVSGYLISTADGRPIDVFTLFSIPATLSDLANQEDMAGLVHKWLAFTLIGLSALHAAAALKHHFIDHDETLVRMLRIQT